MSFVTIVVSLSLFKLQLLFRVIDSPALQLGTRQTLKYLCSGIKSTKHGKSLQLKEHKVIFMHNILLIKLLQ